MSELTNEIITVNLLPSNYNLLTDEENAIDEVVRAAVSYNALSLQLENNPLSLEKLRQMDGEPVWMVDGQGHEMYGIVNDTGCADADYGSWNIDFYGMTGDGKHGLHIMGWIAYAHKPELEGK